MSMVKVFLAQSIIFRQSKISPTNKTKTSFRKLNTMKSSFYLFILSIASICLQARSSKCQKVKEMLGN